MCTSSISVLRVFFSKVRSFTCFFLRDPLASLYTLFAEFFSRLSILFHPNVEVDNLLHLDLVLSYNAKFLEEVVPIETVSYLAYCFVVLKWPLNYTRWAP